MSFPPVRSLALAEERGVLLVELARPDARNAMTLAMVEELRGVFQHAEQRSGLRALVLRGRGGHFCARRRREGAGPRARRARDPDAQPRGRAQRRVRPSVQRLRAPQRAHRGRARGLGLGRRVGLACSADIALAGESARFGLPETSLGIVPAQIAPFLVERLGYAQAKRLALLGGKIDAREALEVGLVHEVHGEGAALEAALAANVTRLLACAPEATRATKRLLLHIHGESRTGLIEHAAQVFAAALTSAEGAEGTRAFIEKRPPAWRV